MTVSVDWPGQSGRKYKYFVHNMNGFTNNKGGNYIFAKKNGSGNWVPIYIGQTGDLSERFDAHHKMDCAKKKGATHIHAHLNPRSADRIAEEMDLIKNFEPPCNG